MKDVIKQSLSYVPFLSLIILMDSDDTTIDQSHPHIISRARRENEFNIGQR